MDLHPPPTPTEPIPTLQQTRLTQEVPQLRTPTARTLLQAQTVHLRHPTQTDRRPPLMPTVLHPRLQQPTLPAVETLMAV